MTTECFNLVDEPWLPVTLGDGFPDRDLRGPAPRVSLHEVFHYGDRIIDLHCYPHERIALMRLLICIAQRALDGPETEEEWRGCCPRIGPEAVKYLNENKRCFNLLGDGPRFLQMRGNSQGKRFSMQKLRFVDKDASTLFDAHVGPSCELSPAEAAVSLVAFQSFAAGGRVEGSSASLAGGLCREGSALHAFICGTSLLETVWFNTVPKEQLAKKEGMTVGNPSWHQERNPAKSFLYRLAPIARYLWLEDDLAYCEGTGGQDFSTFERNSIRELTTAVKLNPQGRNRREQLVSGTSGKGLPKAAWRELHSVAILRSAQQRGGPAALEHIQTLREKSNSLRLWCGALVGGGKNRAAAVGDIVEGAFLLPVGFVESVNTVNDLRSSCGPNLTYREGVEFSDHWQDQLKEAVKMYHKRLADTERASIAANQAASRYWTALEQLAEPILLWDVAMRSDKYWSSDSNWMAKSPWGKEVKKAAHDAYDFACPHATPRQIRAYAAGLSRLVKQSTGQARRAEEDDEDSDVELGDDS